MLYKDFKGVNMNIAIIGMGNMGSRYARMICDDIIKDVKLVAVTRISADKKELLERLDYEKIPVFDSADALFDKIEKGELKTDAVIIATPHYSHEEIAKRAFKNRLHVLCEKPSGVYSRQARLMEESAEKSGCVFGMMFNQRTRPVYQRLHDIVQSGKYGNLKRVNWTVTDWYRPNLYYKTSSWHATWAKDGGGVILNQCPHNLDLLHWICGMPSRVQGFCPEGQFHDIEVEDDVTAYFEWGNGASGVFVTSTGDAPGINRLEISLEEAMIVCENNTIRIGEIAEELGCKEALYRAASTDFFRPIHGVGSEITVDCEEDTYEKVLQNFADACRGKTEMFPSGYEGRKSLLIGNAIYLSSWENRMVEIPEEGSVSETEFERIFEEHLSKRRNNG